MVFLLLGIYVIILFLEVPGLLKKQMYKELVVFAVFFILGVYATLANFYNWPLFTLDFFIRILA